MTDFELVKFQHNHVKTFHLRSANMPTCDVCLLLEVMMRLRRENEELRELVDKMTSGLRHKG